MYESNSTNFATYDDDTFHITQGTAQVGAPLKFRKERNVLNLQKETLM